MGRWYANHSLSDQKEPVNEKGRAAQMLGTDGAKAVRLPQVPVFGERRGQCGGSFEKEVEVSWEIWENTDDTETCGNSIWSKISIGRKQFEYDKDFFKVLGWTN